MDVKKVSYSGGNGNLNGQLFTPETHQSISGLVLAHAWWGINDEIVQHARDFAALGPYKLLLPDFYRGQVSGPTNGLVSCIFDLSQCSNC